MMFGNLLNRWKNRVRTETDHNLWKPGVRWHQGQLYRLKSVMDERGRMFVWFNDLDKEASRRYHSVYQASIDFGNFDKNPLCVEVSGNGYFPLPPANPGETIQVRIN